MGGLENLFVGLLMVCGSTLLYIIYIGVFPSVGIFFAGYLLCVDIVVVFQISPAFRDLLKWIYHK